MLFQEESAWRRQYFVMLAKQKKNRQNVRAFTLVAF